MSPPKFESVSPSWIDEIPTEVLGNVMNAGYLAAGAGRFADARRIFAGLIAVRPGSELPWIGLAVVEMNAGNALAALDAMRQAESRNKHSEVVRGFLAIVLRMNRQNAAADEILTELSEQDGAVAMRQLAAATVRQR